MRWPAAMVCEEKLFNAIWFSCNWFYMHSNKSILHRKGMKKISVYVALSQINCPKITIACLFKNTEHLFELKALDLKIIRSCRKQCKQSTSNFFSGDTKSICASSGHPINSWNPKSKGLSKPRSTAKHRSEIALVLRTIC